MDHWPERGLPGETAPAEVPGVWNTTYPSYSGIAWYECRFTHDRVVGSMMRLVCGGSNYQTDTWMNGRYLGRHAGGYDAFSFRCRQAIRKGENRLTLRIVDPPLDGAIDGLSLRTCPTAKESWYGGAGGLWGGLWLEESDRVWLEDVRVTPDLYGRQLTYRLTFASDLSDSARVAVFTQVNGERGKHSLDVSPTGASVTVTVPAPEISPWTPEAPTLYRTQVSFTRQGQQSPTEMVDGQVGFRTVELRDGVLYLNGSPRYVKGALLQPTYPRDLLLPQPRTVRRDVEQAKAAGLNLLRVHLRPPLPALLRYADSIGMMVYAEPPLAWIEPSGRLLEHGRRELAAMVRACANHPSVVLWGIFNENARATEAVGGDLLTELARLDPTRPIIENSGGAAVGEVGMWAWAGQSRCWSPGWGAPRLLNDLHVYLANPLRAEARTLLETLGDGPTVNATPGRPVDEQIESRLTSDAVLVSEYGCGALPDFDAALAAFGDETHLADARLLSDLRDSLERGLARRGLVQEIGDVKALVEQTQTLQAEGIRAQTLALRRNPRVSGLIVTQLADAGWEQMAGLTGLWRHPRPALEALRQALEPRALHIQPDAPCATDSVTVRIWLVEDPGLPELRDEAVLAVGLIPPSPQCGMNIGVGDRISSAAQGQASVRVHSIPIRLPARSDTGRLLSTMRMALPELPGRYVVRAQMSAHGWRHEAACTALRLPDCPPHAGDGLIVLGQELKNLLPAAEMTLRTDWRGPVLLDIAHRPAAHAVAEAVRAAHHGAHVCVIGLDPANLDLIVTATGLPLALHGARGNFMGIHHYRKAHPVFENVGGAGLADGAWAETLPAWSLDELSGADVIAGCFTVPDGGHEFLWRATVQTVPYGDGRITFWQLPLGSHQGGILGGHLLSSLARWLTDAPR